MKPNESFNNAAKLYDEVRPSYPNQVIDWIIKEAKLDINKELLEIAPGTGQATKCFASKNYKIHCVELGNELANLLIKNCQDYQVTVDVSAFEDWIPSNNKKYQAIYCATAFHWLNPDIKYRKCFDLLEDQGYLILMWNNAIGTTNKIINEAYKLLFSYYPNKPFSTKPKSEEELNNQTMKGKLEIDESKYFQVENFLDYRWNLNQSKEKTIKGFYSQSSYLSLEEKTKLDLTYKLNKLFEGLEEEVFTEFITTVYICKKII